MHPEAEAEERWRVVFSRRCTDTSTPTRIRQATSSSSAPKAILACVIASLPTTVAIAQRQPLSPDERFSHEGSTSSTQLRRLS
jgi:hypothetical protein